MVTALATGLGALPFLFIKTLDRFWIDDVDHVEIASLGGMDARKAFLIIAVMTARSFAEGWM